MLDLVICGDSAIVPFCHIEDILHPNVKVVGILEPLCGTQSQHVVVDTSADKLETAISIHVSKSRINQYNHVQCTRYDNEQYRETGIPQANTNKGETDCAANLLE